MQMHVCVSETAIKKKANELIIIIEQISVLCKGTHSTNTPPSYLNLRKYILLMSDMRVI